METELFAAVEAGDVGRFQELIKKETKETIDQVDFYGYTALHAAGENGRTEMVGPLLDAGANIDRADYAATFTAVHHALAKGHFDTARVLVDRGADLNLLNEGGVFGSALHYAVYQNNPEFVKYVLSKGADVNLLSGQGYSPLHQAAMGDQPEICQLLLGAGADTAAQDEEQLTPLHFAARDGLGEVAMVLVKAGSDLFARQHEGKTPKDLADFVNEQEMVAFLGACETGQVPASPPRKQDRGPVVHREIVVPEGWGPG